MAESQPNARLEAFSDGVFAIALTLLIIDVRLPPRETITSTPELVRALRQLLPSIFAFLLSFVIILITWVNHHAALKRINRASAPFIYTNGLMLLTVVFIPFPTSLLGAFLLTDHAAPAVVLYNAVIAAMSTSWILLAGTALKNRLTCDEASVAMMREARRRGYFAVALYALLSVAAIWFPLPVAIVTTMTWIFWLTLSISLDHS